MSLETIIATGIDIFGEPNFKEWLFANNEAANGARPIDLLETEGGMVLVNDLLEVIRWSL